MGKKKKIQINSRWAIGPDGVLRVRNSERGTMDKCPQRWWWAWAEGLRPKETPKALWFGTGIHVALAHYYQKGKKRNKDFIDVWREYADKEAEYMRVHIGSIDEEKFITARSLGETMLTGYLQEHQGDPSWDVIATEQSFELSIPFGGTNDLDSMLLKKILKKYGDAFILNGTFDGVYRDRRDKQVRLMEHKTAASISVGHLPMDNQAGTYWLVAQSVGHAQGWLKKNEGIKEITYNFLRKAVPDDRPKDGNGYSTNKPGREHYIAALQRHGFEFARNTKQEIKPPTIAVMQEWCEDNDITVLGEVSKIQPPALFERHPVTRAPAQRATQLRRLQDEVVRMIAVREGWLPLTKSPGRDTCPMCPFKEMCELHEHGADWEGYRDSMFRTTDPYADHRKSA